MHWLIENLQVVIAVVIFITMVRRVLLAQRPNRSAADNAEEAERMRKIREELRKKMAERRAGASIDLPPSERRLTREEVPPGVFGEPEPPWREVIRTHQRSAEPPLVLSDFQEPQSVPTAASPSIDEAMLAQQRELERKIARLQAVTAEKRIAGQANMVAAMSLEDTPNLVRTAVLADLKDPAGIKRAFLMREILGAPVALR